MADGVYRVRFQISQRNCCSAINDQGLSVLVNGAQVGTVRPANNGTNSTFTSNAFAVGSPNNALAFDGVNNYVALPTSLNTANFTFETWINY